MRYALISDLHANLEALTAVLDRIDAAGVDHILCLGDLVGYHADPNACVDLVRERGITCIAGNHDLAAIGARDTEHFGAAARVAIDWTRPRLSETNRAYLAGLPLTLRVGGALLVHGALHPEPNVELHLSGDRRVRASIERLGTEHDTDVCFFGHTHRPVAWRLEAGGLARLHQAHTHLTRGARWMINPGSVGQSRDGDPRAAFALYDPEARTVTIERVAYDLAGCLRKAAAAGLLIKEGRLRKAAHKAADWVAHGRQALRKRLPGLG
jgi:predicted phosphodiesterase